MKKFEIPVEIYMILTEEQIEYLELMYGEEIDWHGNKVNDDGDNFDCSITINDCDANFITENFNSSF
jgi:hypothetical protein